MYTICSKYQLSLSIAVGVSTLESAHFVFAVTKAKVEFCSGGIFDN
jgi:hypothetical protein